MIVLLVVFVLICVLLVGLVLLQNEEGGGMGGLFGSGGSAAFGSRSATVLTKATYVLVILFFMTSLGLALLNKGPSIQAPIEAAQEQGAVTNEWWPAQTDTETNTPPEVPAGN